MVTSAKPRAGSVDRAFLILELLNSSKRGWNISEISRKLEIPKSTTHVLISTLDRLGYIRQHPSSRRFQLSTKLFGLGRRSLNVSALPDAAPPPTFAGWCTRQDSRPMWASSRRTRSYSSTRLMDPGIIKFDTYIGKTSELHCTGLGKSLVAFQPEDSIETLLSNYSYNRFTKKTICSRAMFMLELARVRPARVFPLMTKKRNWG